jgi:hypothetical protein
MLIDLETYPPEQSRRIDAMMRAAEIELALPRYATILDQAEAQAEFARQVAKVIATLEATAPVAFQGLPPSTKPVAKLPSTAGTPRAGGAGAPWQPLPPGPHLVTGKSAAGKLTLTPQDAAERFLAWLRATNHTGKFSGAELRALYRNHCLASGLAWSPENLMREALRDLPGVSKYSTYRKVKGQRVRPVVWEIGHEPALRRAA